MATRRTFEHVSPTQIKLFQDCPRKWYYRYMLGIKPPPTPALLRGSKVHDELELYGKKGTVPTDPIAIALLQFLPEGPFPEGWSVEGAFTGPLNFSETLSALELKLTGRIDLARIVSSGIAEITDYKTSSDVKRYAMTDIELGKDVAAILYGMHWLDKDPSVELVQFRWLYTDTKRPGVTKAVNCMATRDVIFGRAMDLEPTLTGMWAVGQAEEARDVAKKTSACFKYGGCPFRSRCDAVPSRMQERRPLFGMGEAAVEVVKEESTVDLDDLFGGAQPAPPRTEKKDEKMEIVDTSFQDSNTAIVSNDPASTLTLYIGCAPVGLKTPELSDLLQPLCQEVAEENGVPHYAMIGYGKGPGLVIGKLVERGVDSFLNGSRAIVCDPRLPLTKHALEVLMGQATEIVRGFF